MKTTNWNLNNGKSTIGGYYQLPTAFDKIFNEMLETTGVEASYRKYPLTNISETPTQFKLECLLPGFEKDEIKIFIENNQLNISSEMKSESLSEEENYKRKEFKKEMFSRRFNLPEQVNKETIEAEYRNGVLQILLPKISSEIKANKEITIK